MAVQTITGDPLRTAGQNGLEPDLGISWLQPGSRFGMFQLEVRGARRQDRLHPGKIFAAVRDLKYRGISWSIEAGDTHFVPAIGEYKFSNVFTPAITFSGAAVTAGTKRSTLVVAGGRTSAWRNIFGSDPETLGQVIGSARATHKYSDRLDLSARVSSVHTSSLKEFGFTIAASEQAGGGARLWILPSLQLAADASLVSYRRVGSGVREQDTSSLVGASWLHKRGWLQVNASRFSPGDFPALNTPLPDREGIFAATDYDISLRVRLFSGWEAFRSNLNPAQSLLMPQAPPESSGTRGFGGVRVQLGTRSTVTLRAERGDRVSRPLSSGPGSDSDTGSWAAEWQAAAGKFTGFTRYSRRHNVDRMNDGASYGQHDGSAQLFANLTRTTQAFVTALATRTDFAQAGGSTYWQIGGGTQLQVPKRELWVRAEGNFARNIDRLTESYVPRESFNLGLNGQLTKHMTIALNVSVDRSPPSVVAGSPWMTRSMFRVTRSLPTGSAYVNNAAAVTEAAAMNRGTGSVIGSVFADWNANGLREADEATIEGIPVRIGAENLASTGGDGQFSFLNVPVGRREVGLDTGSLPLDYDAPEIAYVEVELARGGTRRVSFGLHPLGMIEGRVSRDVNGNGKADSGDEPVEGAVVILNGGARSEQVRGGRFRFDSVRSGDHRITLLLESLPDGAAIIGDAEVSVALTRASMAANVPFAVAIEKRPEIRKVFPPKGGGSPAAARRGSPSRPGAAPARPPETARPAPLSPRSNAPLTSSPLPAATGRFAIQIAALSESANASGLLRDLQAAGLPAYVLAPESAGPGVYRVRVGPYRTRAAAQEVVAKVEGNRSWKAVWVVQEK
jgi:cell division septation protein DedD